MNILENPINPNTGKPYRVEIISQVEIDKRIKNKDLDFSMCFFRCNASFTNMQFYDNIDFNNAIFAEDVSFSSAIFHKSANFFATKFLKSIHFGLASFYESVDFNGAVFFNTAELWNVVFYKNANFKNTMFIKKSLFNDTTFSSNANFSNVTFTEEGYFDKAIFSEEANFTNVIFSKKISFTKTIFSKKANFRFTAFLENTYFQFKNCEEIDFYDTLFEKKVNFLKISELDTKPANRETARLIKHKFVELDNQVDALNWYVKEMEMALMDKKTKVTDWLILNIEQWVSNFGTSPIRVFGWILFVFFIFWFSLVIIDKYIIVNCFFGKFIQIHGFEFKNVFYYFFKFTQDKSYGLIFDILFIIKNLILIFLSYELVKSLRKFSRKL